MNFTGDKVVYHPSVSTYGVWIKARLDEVLSPELAANIDEVSLSHMWAIDRMVALVRRKGRKEGFKFDCGFRAVYEREQSRMIISPEALARLILFLQ